MNVMWPFCPDCNRRPSLTKLVVVPSGCVIVTLILETRSMLATFRMLASKDWLVLVMSSLKLKLLVLVPSTLKLSVLALAVSG